MGGGGGVGRVMISGCFFFFVFGEGGMVEGIGVEPGFGG